MRRRGQVISVLGVLSSLILALTVAPSNAGAGPALDVTPTKGLIDPLGDGQFVRASWSGMPPGEPVYLRQCTRHPRSVKDCSQTGTYLGPGLITAGISQPDGTGSITFAVRVGLVNSTLLGEPTKISFPCDFRHDCTIALFIDPDAKDVDSAVKVPISFAFPPDACPPSSSPYLSGGGGSAVFRAMLDWAASACRPPLDIRNQYVLDSGPRGREDFAGGLLDYAVGMRAFSDRQIDELGEQHMDFGYAPVSASALVFGIRLFDRITNQQVRDIRLTPELLAEIFTGQITNWNDPRILALNPGHVDSDGHGTLPTKLHAIARADASDTSYELTSYFWATARSQYIAGGVGLPGGNPFEEGPTEIFPSTGTIGLFQGARVVAREVARPSQDTTPDFGYIGAMDSSWAELYGVSTVKVENSAGQFVTATPASVLAAVAQMHEDPDGGPLTPDFTASDPDAYPLPTVEYAYVRHDEAPDTVSGFDGTDGRNLKRFLSFAVSAGQEDLPLGYAPLPDELVAQTRQALQGVPDHPSDLGGDDGPIPPGGEQGPATFGGPTGGGIDDLTGGESDAGLDDTIVDTSALIERGPTVAATPLAATVARLALPVLFAMCVAGIVVGFALMISDRRRRSRAATGRPSRWSGLHLPHPFRRTRATS